MRKPFITMILSLVTIGLAGWCLISLYNTLTQFSNVLTNPEPPWEITFYIIPFVLLILFGGVLSIIYTRQKKYKQKSSLLLFPFEFSEEDEREKQISGEACRKAFISTWVTAPLAATLLVFYPLIQDRIAFYPILLILIIPVVQILTYYMYIRKI